MTKRTHKVVVYSDRSPLGAPAIDSGPLTMEQALRFEASARKVWNGHPGKVWVMMFRVSDERGGVA